MTPRAVRLLLVLLCTPLFSSPGFAQQVDAPLKDHRLEPLKDLNGFFPLEVPETLEAWKKRQQELRLQVQVAVGLYPMPEKTPLNAVIHSLVKRDNVIIERVYFESIPGFYVTGQLFRPSDEEGPLPVILCPHGHGGRLQDVGPERILQQIVKGEERFESSGRMPKIARCVQLARMGCLVFMLDMIGYGDNNQLSYDFAHRFAKQREDLQSPNRYGFFSAQAEMRMQSIMGLQVWNCIRSLDFLLEHPQADPSKVAVTGNSGGGTQTILTCALDDRVHVAFPQGMVSTAMQGGCTCENASLLRVGSGNVELAALFAPKPQAMTAADDWTIDMLTVGAPELKAIYNLYGKGANVACYDTVHFPHNFNYPTRHLMYEWMNQHLRLGLKSPIVEPDYEMLTSDELHVWNDVHPEPSLKDVDCELAILKYFNEEHENFFSQLDREGGRESELAKHVLPALRAIVGRGFDDVSKLTGKSVGVKGAPDNDELAISEQYLCSDEAQECVKTKVVMKTKRDDVTPGDKYIDRFEIVLRKEGSDLESFTFDAEKREQLANGKAYFFIDLFGQGTTATSGTDNGVNRVVRNPREAPAYTYTYNDPLLVQRVHDIMTVLSKLKELNQSLDIITITADAATAPAAIIACCLLPEPIAELNVTLDGFRFENITDYRDPNFLPGAIKYGDVETMLELVNAQKVNVK